MNTRKLRRKHRFLAVAWLAAAVAVSYSSRSRADEASDAQQWLSRELEIIRVLRPKVEHEDLPRLVLLESTITETVASLTQLGIGNQETINHFYDLNLKFRFSADQLKPGVNSMRSKDGSPLFDELLGLNEKIAKARKFDEELTRGTTVTSSTFTKMYDLLSQLVDNAAVDENLREKIRAVIPELGRAKAVASGGDQLRDTMDAGEIAYHSLEGLYGDFDRVEASNTAFSTIMLIQGLNEFYADFVKLRDASPHDLPKEIKDPKKSDAPATAPAAPATPATQVPAASAKGVKP